MRCVWLLILAGCAWRPALAQEARNAAMFLEWRLKHVQQVQPFEAFLEREKLAGVVPLYQLLRSASMWRECRAQPFQVPPPDNWGAVRDVLALLEELQKRQVMGRFEVVSAYRDPALNACAGGAPKSSHVRFAVDLLPLAGTDAVALCAFWRSQGKQWNMGISRYPSGRIHIDRTGWRTWGASHGRGSSFCLAKD